MALTKLRNSVLSRSMLKEFKRRYGNVKIITGEGKSCVKHLIETVKDRLRVFDKYFPCRCRYWRWSNPKVDSTGYRGEESGVGASGFKKEQNLYRERRHMHRRTLTTVLVMLLLTSAGGCIALKSSSKQEKVSGTGTIKYINLEGGFYGIVSDDGKNYDPINLPEEFKKDGLKVSFEAEKSNAFATHMWGDPY